MKAYTDKVAPVNRHIFIDSDFAIRRLQKDPRNEQNFEEENDPTDALKRQSSLQVECETCLLCKTVYPIAMQGIQHVGKPQSSLEVLRGTV
jgi:hypothetical protein